MDRIGQTLTLDFLRRGRWLFLQLLAIPLWPFLFYLLLAHYDKEITTYQMQLLFFITLLMVALIGTILPLSIQTTVDPATLSGGFPSRLYTLPVSTVRLVFWQLASGLVLIALVQLYASLVIRLLTGIWPPLVEPVFFLMAVYASSAAVLWSLPRFVVLRLLVLAAVLAGLGAWMMDTYSAGAHRRPGEVWGAPSAFNLLWMVAALATAFTVAVRGVARDRCGDAQGGPGFHALWHGLLDRLPRRDRPFASPQAAQFWLERRQKGWIMPAGALLAVLVLLGIWITQGAAASANMLGALVGLPFYYALTALPVGIVMGRCDLSAKPTDLDLFRATRPLTDCALASAMHKTGAFSILLSTAICLAAALLSTAALTLAGQDELATGVWRSWSKEFAFSGLGLGSYPIMLLLAVLGAWIVLSLATVLGQAGHGVLMARATACLMALVIATIFAQFFAPMEVTQWFIGGTLLALGSAFLLGGAAAIFYARRRGLVGPRMSAICALLWMLCFGIGLVIWRVQPPGTLWTVNTFWLGVMTLAPATPMLGALAIAWNRHR